jgi:UDP-N-acetylmuramoylalanine--D-glutamate ligase
LDARDDYDVLVLELSSYQTADIGFSPDIVGITNLHPEHVDWHGSVDRYYEDKLHLAHDGGTFPVLFGPQAAQHPLVAKSNNLQGRNKATLRAQHLAAVTDAVSSSRLKGAHNLENAILAARLALLSEASISGVVAGIKAFTPLAHRLDEHAIGNMLFVDDSISTTPVATLAALSAYASRKIALIAGGYERQQDWGALIDYLVQNPISALVCLPETGARLAAGLQDRQADIEIVEASSLEAGMTRLVALNQNFDTVILSPGAPSFNQYANFGERGDAFVSFAEKLFGA